MSAYDESSKNQFRLTTTAQHVSQHQPVARAPAGLLNEKPEPPAAAKLRKYLRIYRVSLTERLVYRGDFFLSTILRFLPMVTTILL